MKSPTYGNVDSKRIVEIINEYFLKNNCYGSGFEVTIGTDSQNFSDTKVVSVEVFISMTSHMLIVSTM